jgi:hypothetical protein
VSFSICSMCSKDTIASRTRTAKKVWSCVMAYPLHVNSIVLPPYGPLNSAASARIPASSNSSRAAAWPRRW